MIVYDDGNNYQQYENKINKSTLEKGEKRKKMRVVQKKGDKKEQKGKEKNTDAYKIEFQIKE